ncbi:NAD(P)H-dependent oxidoreductase subunit E [Bacteroidota bacterium]
MNKEIINIVDRIVKDKGTASFEVIPILQAIQNEFNYLPQEAIKHVCEITDITLSQITGISTFYTQFRHNPVGKHIIKVCVGTACHVKGAMQVYDALRRKMKLKDNEDTDSEGLFTIEKVACMGCCTIAPVIQIDNITYGYVNTEKVSEIFEDFLNVEHKSSKKKVKTITDDKEIKGEIRIGLGSCCIASGSANVMEELENTIRRNNIDVNIKHVGCVGICNQVPLMEILKPGEETALYTKIAPEEVKAVVHKHFKSDKLIDKVKNSLNNFFENVVFDSVPKSLKRYSLDDKETPVSEFLNGQVNIATEYHGILKPSDINEYKRLGGFHALSDCMKKTSPAEIINILKESGLKGRGGAGFLTGEKWEQVKNTRSAKKYVICNGDEGDPGAFMDRMLLESYPFRVIEGIIIAAYAVGADEGLLYIRAEYPLAVQRVKEAIQTCEKDGYLGSKILNSDFSFQLKIFEGAGAFVCGEETALIASVEGKRGNPTFRPPYPSEKGLWNKPTLINNTETFSMMPWIIRKGALAFNSIGTEYSKGTKVFALAGKVKRGGLIEVPMGISIRKIVEDIGGGIADGKQFKAVQIGGPSGGCLPASMADTTIDFVSLTDAGAMMGSGGLVVLDENDCMVDIARYFLAFTQDQSCGKCTFCRIGTRKMLEILDKICNGKGNSEDLNTLEKLADNIKKGSMCGLGRSAPNPVLTTLKYFRKEYEAHIEGTCPTGKCKEIIEYEINSNCIGCTKCAQRCPSDAIISKAYERHWIDKEKCIKCDICKQTCSVDAVITR